jgi:hypothetical protein
MELDIKKTAADAAYIAVGAGVLGFQQAQVRRKEAGDRLATIAKDTQTAVGTQAAAIRTKVSDGTTGGLDSATTAVKSLDPRPWVEPVIGDVRQRVEPVIEQIKGLAVTVPAQVPEQLNKVPGHLNKAVEVGKARVQSIRGDSTV